MILLFKKVPPLLEIHLTREDARLEKHIGVVTPRVK